MAVIPRAQMGLEYLLTYGWALVVVITVVSALVFVAFQPPTEKANFSAGGRQIIVKASNITDCAGTDSAAVLLENMTGEQIKITNVSSTGSFLETGGAAITVNGSRPPVVVAAGKQIRLEKIDAACGAIGGDINISYTDKDGFSRTASVSGLGNISCCVGARQCSNGEQRNCPLQFGVCSGAKETCTNETWPGCTTANYGAAFEAAEATCTDLQDNDCDNKFDCNDNDCQARSECETYCTTQDPRFPVKGGIEFVMHEGPPGDCLDWQVGGSTFFLKNLSGQTITVNSASVSLGPSHFDDYTASSCGFGGYFDSPDCEDSADGNYPGGYNESFALTTINGVLGSGENCELNVSSLPGEEIEIEISSFTFCANRSIYIEPECEYPNEEILRAHKDNPITIPINTSIGTITLYCYNFPPTHCTDGEQRDCSLQFGVCAGAKETCTDGAWPGCTAASYGALYETAEATCTDLLDSDCDGKTDCDDEDCKSSNDCKIYATTYDFRFPVKGGITTAYMEVKGCIEVIDHLQAITIPSILRLSPSADENCTNWGIEGNMILLKNLSGQTITVNSASVSLGPSHFDEYTAESCSFFGHFSSDRCPDSNSGDKGGFTESFALTSINGVPGTTQNCSINTSIPDSQEIRVGVSDFSYCANRLPPECECSTDVMLREHKDNPITITLNTNIGTINIYLYNFPTDSPI